MTTLYSAERMSVTLTEAVGESFGTNHDTINSGGANKAAALLYTPRRCIVARITGAALSDADGDIDTSMVYEARCFDGDMELRWLRVPGDEEGRGTAVLLAEDELRLPEEWTRHDATNVTTTDGTDLTLPGSYVLWGTTQPVSVEGWTDLWEARVPIVRVPLAMDGPQIPAGARLALYYREYVGEDEHGNAYVTDERLIGFSTLELVGKR